MSALTTVNWLRQHPVARRHPLKAWGRWIYWQVRQRFTARPKLMKGPNETRLWIYPHEGLTGFWYSILPDYAEMSFLANYLRAGDVFYDVGSNAGGYAVYAAGLGCRVVAFEPVPLSFARLRENVEVNRPSCSIEPVNLALGSQSGSLEMTSAFGTGNHVVAGGQTEGLVVVEATTLDEFVRSSVSPGFLKIDVEGYELEVLSGASEVLASPALQGLLLETFRPHNWQQPMLRQMETILSGHGFKPYHYDFASNTILPLEREDEGENNTFYFRDPVAIQSRLAESGESAGRLIRE